MKKEILLCDACGAETNLETMRLVVGRSCDGCGGNSDDVEYVDLCSGCLRAFILNAIKRWYKATDLVEWIKERKAKNEKVS